jgi:TRAP-type C4-dicarboxylate transport system substrate-binding protein
MLELPFMIKNEKEADLMRKRLNKAFREILTSQGYIFGGIVEVGFDNFFSKFPITTLKDFAGKGFWAWKDNKIHVRYIQECDEKSGSEKCSST